MALENQVNAIGSLESRYNQLVAGGKISDDAAQRTVLAVLQAVSLDLQEHPPGEVAGGLLRRWFAKRTQMVRNVYIWGNVGRGKSMLMDLFFDNTAIAAKRRVHFHAFMQEVYGRLHQLRGELGYKGDPVMTLAQEIAAKTQLLCFDELQATDVADASLLHRLFSGLLERSVVIISTSNHPPSALYTGGVQRERFAKFIALIEKKMRVLALSSTSDYRTMQTKSLQKSYFYPLGAAADAFIEGIIAHLAHGVKAKDDVFVVQGRTTHFTLYPPKTGRFTFQALCKNNVGPADYLALAKRLDTVILTGIPALSPEQRNEAKRFMTLVDALYESKVKLICTAVTAPEGIYKDGDVSFEFARTVSRLAEMQSEKWAKN